MGNRKRKYTCADCKWNFICKSGATVKCKEFTLDQVMSDTYADWATERNRRVFNEDYRKYLSDWEDE